MCLVWGHHELLPDMEGLKRQGIKFHRTKRFRHSLGEWDAKKAHSMRYIRSNGVRYLLQDL